MQFSFSIKTRDDFIDFARSIGHIVRDRSNKEQTLIGFGGDADSGKSLLAFGIDMAFRPEQYPNGMVQLYRSAERALSGEFNKQGLVIYENFRHDVYLTRENFDRGMRYFKSQHPDAKVLCYANAARTIGGEHDYATKGMDSDELDMSVRVYNTDEIKNCSPNASFKRRVVVDVADNAPFVIPLIQLMREERFAEPSAFAKRMADAVKTVQNAQVAHYDHYKL